MKALVIGMARSGTSFLGEIFHQNPDLVYLYEPFWGDTSIKACQFFWRTEEDSWPEGETLLRDAFDGRFEEACRRQSSPWQSKRFTSRWEELNSQLGGRTITNGTSVVIKEIRLNLQLRWVQKVMGPDLQFVHLVRDPRGVVGSFLFQRPREIPSLQVMMFQPLTALKALKRWIGPRETMFRHWGWEGCVNPLTLSSVIKALT